MKEEKYRIVHTQRKFDGKIIQVLLDEVKMPDGKVHQREVVRHKGAVGIVPITDGEVVLVRQYRHPTRESLLEIPAGKLSIGEDPKKCALRELEEETGHRAEELVTLAEFYTTPGYSNEYFYLYLAIPLRSGRMSLQGGEELDLEVLKVPLQDALDMISSGEIKDGKTIAGLCLAERHLHSSSR